MKKEDVMIARLSDEDFIKCKQDALNLVKGIVYSHPKREQVPIMLFWLRKFLEEYIEGLNFKTIFFGDCSDIEYYLVSKEEYKQIMIKAKEEREVEM